MTKENLVYRRSRTGHYNKFQDSLKILEYSLMMVEFFDLKEFNNVIAVQLRIILHDMNRGKDNSLLYKINRNPKLHPVSDLFKNLDDKGSSFIPVEQLFDYTKTTIELANWLNQVIYKIRVNPQTEQLHEITIKDFIKLSANKSGGAHVDSELTEKALIVDVHSEKVLNHIAKCLFRSLGRDLNEAHVKNLRHIYKKLREASK